MPDSRSNGSCDKQQPSTSNGAPKKKKIRLQEDTTSEPDTDFVVGSQESEEDESDESIAEVAPYPQGTNNRSTASIDDDDVQVIANSHFLPYAADWTPHQLYRLQGDVVATSIRESGSEGQGRMEIARRVGIDSGCKAGNRRISAVIQNVTALYPKHVGQYQKMEGKIRTIRYFWKEASEPARFTALYKEISDLIGRPCPFKMGQVIKFPESTLSTLRLSDVSLGRLLTIIRLTETLRVIVTMHKLMTMIQHHEQESGYLFQADKKSILKCLRALEKEGLIRVYTREVADEKIAIVCHPSITDGADDEVQNAIKSTIDEYNREARIFPHGQCRFGEKVARVAGMLKEENDQEDEKLIDEIQGDINDNGTLTINQRYELVRLRTSRISYQQRRTKEKRERDEAEQAAIASALEEAQPVFADFVNVDPFKSPPKPPNQGIRLGRGTELGYQAKMIRLMLMHEIVYQMTRGLDDGIRPTLFERFPPGSHVDDWPELQWDMIPVMVDEESPLRFVPRCAYEGQPKGWVMVQDVVASLPLSIYILCCKPDARVTKERVMSFLKDPLKRHTLLADLPPDMRTVFVSDRTVEKQVKMDMVEHMLFLLSAMGLACIGENPNPQRFSSSGCTMFYIYDRGRLYDTSPSDRGYCTVTPPMEKYNRYDYTFCDIADVYTYWHHLRAIVTSTQLSYRSEVATDMEKIGQHRGYSLGSVDKMLITKSIDVAPLGMDPIGECDGVAGFDASLYIHLQRHWDPNPNPHQAVNWVLQRFKRFGERIKTVVEERVERIERKWNSFVRTIVTGEEVRKNNKKRNAILSASRPSCPPKVEVDKNPREMGTIKNKWTKKRPLDEIDKQSQRRRLQMRSRFNSRERDMLILVRAVGFFLNPVYRFWLNPSVLRDIMHEYVPESRTKTVQSLMAAGVREIVRPNRMSYLHRIVCNLATFPEMRALRYKLQMTPLATEASRTIFFRDAFRIANQLLFMESQCVPSINATPAQFDAFINSGKFRLGNEITASQHVPLRCQAPTSPENVVHCMGTNVLMATLLQMDGTFSEYMLDQLPASLINQLINTFRSDGLLSRVRNQEVLNGGVLASRNQANLSYFFRSKFIHRYYTDCIDRSLEQFLKLSEEGHVAMNEEDNAGVVIAALAAFYGKKELHLSVHDSIVRNFDTRAESANEISSTKQIRYLEGADLQLELIEVSMGPTEDDYDEPTEYPDLPTVVAPILQRNIVVHPDGPPTIEGLVVGKKSADARNLRAVYTALDKAGVFGTTLEDLKKALPRSVPVESLSQSLHSLDSEGAVFEGGIDARRFILSKYLEQWTVNTEGGRRVAPRPWHAPTGELSYPTIRWMTEAVLVAVMEQPTVKIEQLTRRFEVALQGVCITELLEVLEAAGCLYVRKEKLKAMRLSSPFDDNDEEVEVEYVVPTAEAFERFAVIFGQYSLGAMGEMTESGAETFRGVTSD